MSRPTDSKVVRLLPSEEYGVSHPTKRERHSDSVDGSWTAPESALLVRKGDPLDDPFATFWEWDTAEDEIAFADLGSRSTAE
jgi:hypothetical protein